MGLLISMDLTLNNLSLELSQNISTVKAVFFYQPEDTLKLCLDFNKSQPVSVNINVMFIKKECIVLIIFDH